MGIRTVFNMLGPLTNPARANAQVIGVYAEALTEPLARVLAELGTLRAFVVHGADGLDEISNTGPSRVSEVHEGVVRTSTVRPEDFGLPRASIEDLRGGDRAALVVGGAAQDLKDGVAMAARSIDSGAALKRLDDLIELSRRLASE